LIHCRSPRLSPISSTRHLETDLLKQAAERGNKTVDGLGMLLHQAVPGFERWFGVRPEVDKELRELVLADLGVTP
jgi:shikimate dehydrogenase